MIKGRIDTGDEFDSVERSAGYDLRAESLLNPQGFTLAARPGMQFPYIHVPPLYLPRPAAIAKPFIHDSAASRCPRF